MPRRNSRSIHVPYWIEFVGPAAAVALAAFGCSGPNPATLVFEERPGSGGTQTPGATNNGGENPGTDAGTTPGTDGGVVSGGDPIFGTTPFSYVAPAKVANEQANHPQGGVSGKDCIVAGCHLDNGHKWVFAGTVYSAAKNGTPVPKAEVRVVGPDGVPLGSAYTDKDGNFWFDKAGAAIAANSKVGVRKETGAPQRMATPLAAKNTGCSATGTCHGGTQGSVFTP